MPGAASGVWFILAGILYPYIADVNSFRISCIALLKPYAWASLILKYAYINCRDIPNMYRVKTAFIG